jgi:hypothetical protein
MRIASRIGGSLKKIRSVEDLNTNFQIFPDRDTNSLELHLGQGFLLGVSSK